MAEETPAVKDAVSVVRNRRTDAMFVAAYIAIAVLVYIVVYEEKIGEYAQSTVTLVLGMFLNELKNMYNFEQGTTRSSEQKGKALERIAEAAAPTQVVAVAAARAPVPAEPIAVIPSDVKQPQGTP